MALFNILHKNSHVRMSAQLISHDYDQIFIEYLCVAFTMNLAFWISRTTTHSIYILKMDLQRRQLRMIANCVTPILVQTENYTLH